MLTNNSAGHDRGTEVTLLDTFGVYDMQVSNAHGTRNFKNTFKHLRTGQCADQIDGGSFLGTIFIECAIQNQCSAVNRFDQGGSFRAIEQPYFNCIAIAAPEHIKYMPGPLASKTVSSIGMPVAVCKYYQIHFI
jgi:hypothetical protein